MDTAANLRREIDDAENEQSLTKTFAVTRRENITDYTYFGSLVLYLYIGV